MSQQNLLLNPVFSDEGQHWNPDVPGKAQYEDDCCALQTPGSISQSVKITEGGPYRFSVKMKSLQGAACRARLQMNSSSEVQELAVGGGTNWSFQYVDFNAPANTTNMTVTLESNDGSFTEFQSFFDDVVLERR